MTATMAISFVLDTTNAAVPLGFEAWIDQTKFFDTDYVQGSQTVTMQIADNDDEQHQLRLIMKNKLPEHTQVDTDGNIIADARLIITDLSFDEIQLGHMFSEQAKYHHDRNGTAQETVVDKFYREMGCNGTVSLEFATPVYLWLLENM
jgi:hypothetical protein